MQVRSCKRCGNLFKSEVRLFCSPCQKLEEDEFRRVRDYIRANKEAALMEIVEATGVDQKKILDYIRKGRIEIQKEDFGAILKCEICGNVVSKGMLCADCYSKLVKPLKEPVVKEEEMTEEEIREVYHKKGLLPEDYEHIFYRRKELKKEKPK